MAKKRLPVLLGFALVLLFSVGSWQGFQLGAPDFRVFLTAGEHVWNGRSELLYVVSPDRYLYAPGFAWLLAILTPLGFAVSFWLWSLSKLVLTALALVMLVRRFKVSLMIALLTLLTVARPILIDLRYGQINLLVLLSLIFSAMGFSDWMQGKRKTWIWVSWAITSVFAVAKLYALPFLLVPYLAFFWNPDRKSVRKFLPLFLATLLPFSFTTFLPLFVKGWQPGIALLGQWIQALQDKGFPMETHNQSFLAFVARHFTGRGTHVVGLYQEINTTWAAILSDQQLSLVGIGWVLLGLGVILAQLFAFARESEKLRLALLTIGILILPSHLVWKPYFVFALPLAFVAWMRAPALALVATLAMNFSGFSILGLWWGPRLESASVLLWAMLILYVAALQPVRKR